MMGYLDQTSPREDRHSEARARAALQRFEAMLVEGTDLESFDAAQLRVLLGIPFSQATFESRRVFALGWLAWLTGNWRQADLHFGRAGEGFPAQYWQARIGLLVQRPAALAGIECMLRSAKGDPATIAGFVDLLWRAGERQRALEMWKPLRRHPKLLALDEYSGLEARALIAQGDFSAARQNLQAVPSGPVRRAERCLLLAWLASTANHLDEVSTWLTAARKELYPKATVDAWQTLLAGNGVPISQQPFASWLETEEIRLLVQSPTIGAHAEELLQWLQNPASEGHAVQRRLTAMCLLREIVWCPRQYKTLLGDMTRVLSSILPDEHWPACQALAAQLKPNAESSVDPLTRARRLASLVRLDPSHPFPAPEALVGFATKLSEHSIGQNCFNAGTERESREILNRLLEDPDLPAGLAHHLALLYHRAAVFEEERCRWHEAAGFWKRSWTGWLSWGHENRQSLKIIADHLLRIHCSRIRELLERDDVPGSRAFWDLVHWIRGQNGALTELRETLSGSLDELARQCILDARETMLHSAIPDGWRAQYERGLERLRRLLSLDRDNLQLLTAVLEVCNDWFLDLYDVRDWERLHREVERHAPLAMQGIRRCAPTLHIEDLALRSALAEFTKFRAFVTSDLERKQSLYREALELNPANENVRELLSGLDGGAP